MSGQLYIFSEIVMDFLIYDQVKNYLNDLPSALFSYAAETTRTVSRWTQHFRVLYIPYCS